MKTGKRIVSIFLVVLMLLTAAPLAANAATIVDGGTCGDNLTWTFDSDGRLTITGSGAMQNSPTWLSHQSEIKSVSIGSGVTSIGDEAFAWCGRLSSISIPKSVTSIGKCAFAGCDLTSVLIPDSVTSIGESAFKDCILTNLTIPDSVTRIGDYAFSNCTSLASVTIGVSVTSIGHSAFCGCTSLTSVTIGDSVTRIGDDAFYNCTSLTSVTIPDSVTRIGNWAFSCCSSLTSVTIPNSVTSIGHSAFYDCTSLTSVTIGNSVTSIGGSAFSNCTSLASVTIGDSVTSIGHGAFYDCTSLTSVTLPDGITIIEDQAFDGTAIYNNESNWINGVLYIGKHLIKATSSLSGAHSILEGTKSIASFAFKQCNSLTSVTIPDSVTSIGTYAFSHCVNLTGMIIPDNVKNISYGTFTSCYNLTNVTLPESMTNIGDYMFLYCDNLTSLNIPDNVTSIGEAAFSGCSSLTSVTIPNSVTSIGDDAFSGCSSLTSVMLPDSVTSIGERAFEGCSSLTSVTIPDGVTSIGIGAFYKTGIYDDESNWANGVLYIGKHLIKATSSLSGAYSFLEGTRSIASFAFKQCNSLTSVTMGNSVTSIGDYAFEDCTALQSVMIPDGVTSIGDDAFYNCTSLTSVTIPDGVTSIGSGAFYKTGIYDDESNWTNGVLYIGKHLIQANSSLSGAYSIRNNTKCIANWAFYCSDLTSVTIPNSVKSIGAGAFSKCSSLKSMTIPNSVTSIGDGMFYDCTSLSSVTIPYSVKIIDESAFHNCNSLTDVYYGGTQSQWGEISIGSDNEYLKNATIHYNSSGSNDDWSTPVEITVNSFGMTIPCTYQDAYFAKSPYSYNHKMAIASVALASAAMVSTEEHKVGIFNDPERDPIPEPDGSSDYEERVKEIKAQFRAKEFYEAAGFDNYTPRYYNEKPTENSIAFVIASKNIDEIQSTVISIAIRGGGYDAEWGGNFNVGTTQEHRGFSAAADSVFHALDEFLALYVNDIKYKDNVKYWITGYSRSAAVGNLVAAKLTSGDIPVSNNQFSNIERLLPKAVYAYLFEPPKTTKDENAKNSLYNNIFNIINREDPVPRVAPGEWGYKRYGKDCYLPSRETYAGKDYQTLCDKMKEEFVSVAGTEYEKFFSSKKAKENNVIDYHDFVYYDLTGDDSSVLSNCRTGLDLKMNHSFSQGLFYDNLIHYIAKGMKSSEAYSANFQQPITTLLVMAMSAGQYDIPIKDRFRWAVDSYFNDVSLLRNIALAALLKITDAPPWLKKYVLPDFIKDTLTDILYDVLKSEGVTKDSIESMVSATLKGVLPPLVLHYNSVFSALKNICNLVSAHYTQTTASWLLALDGIYEDENQQISNLLSHESTYRVATINCPVNVLVLDNTGNTRARIEDESVSDCLNPLSTYIDENGQKCVVLPNDDSYRFKFTGYDEGQMSVSFSTYDFETGEKLESLNFYDIPIQRGIEITGILSPKNDNSIADDVSLYNGTQSINPSEVVTNSEENLFTVAVESNTDNCYAVGGGTFFKGEYSQVTATAESEDVFDGWYIGDELVSPDANYRFRVDADVTLTAHFKPCVHQYTETVITAPTCTASGESTFTCSICSDTYTETIPALGHTDDNNDGHCDRCGEQMTGGDHCKFCGKIHNGGFFDKLTGFFHKIFAVFKR